MKSYLSLISVSAKMHKRQNRMTRLCIIFAVFLVTAIFSMAEMGVRMESARLLQKHETLTFSALFHSSMVQTLGAAAVFLFLLVLLSGVLMISNSLHSTVAQRTRFFGMMRCLGMSREQIVLFVRLEALNWCKTAIPTGVCLGILSTWILCAVLRFLVGEEFSRIPLFGLSMIGIFSGIAAGTGAVWLAAGAPARRAAKVSPIAAVSEREEAGAQTRPALSFCFCSVETALGVRHALSSSRALLLMTASFALSILLFLQFSVLVDFIGYLLPQSASAADLTLASTDGSNSADSGLPEELEQIPGVRRAFGRRSILDLPVSLASGETAADLISYDDFDLDCLAKDHALEPGSDLAKVSGSSRYVLAIRNNPASLHIGDRIRIGTETLEIAGLLNCDPFSSDGLSHDSLTLIASSETFTRITGVSDYALILIQTKHSAGADTIDAIRSLSASASLRFRDLRGQSTSGTYFAFVFCVYTFLAVIALVSALQIKNSISMSVSARIKTYGAMRAVGMDSRQLTAMLTAEALTYAFCGTLAGCCIGLPLCRQLYGFLILSHFDYAVWHFPVLPLSVILLFVCASSIAAVFEPVRRLHRLPVTDLLKE